MSDPDVDVVFDEEPSGNVVAKFSSAHWEFNVRASAAEFATLGGIESADWDARATLRVGVSAGRPVWWARSDGYVTALVGDDDETWDIAVVMPVNVVLALARQAGGARSSREHGSH